MGRRVLAKCSSVLGKGGPEDSPVVPLDRAFELGYRASYEELAGRGERVLACAMLPLDGADYPEDFDFDDGNFPQEGMYGRQNRFTVYVILVAVAVAVAVTVTSGVDDDILRGGD